MYIHTPAHKSCVNNLWIPLIVSPGNASPYWCSPFYVSLTHVTVHAKCSPTPYWEILWSFAQFEPFTSLGFVISALAGTRLGIISMSLKQWWFMTTRLACSYGPRQNMESSVFVIFPSSGPFLHSLWYFCLLSPFHAPELPLISYILYYVLLEFTCTSIHSSVSRSIIQKGMTDWFSNPPIPPSLPGLFLHVHLPFNISNDPRSPWCDSRPPVMRRGCRGATGWRTAWWSRPLMSGARPALRRSLAAVGTSAWQHL